MTGNLTAAIDFGGSCRLPTIRAFERALIRETHLVQSRPGLLWQQMFNVLQWEGQPGRAVLSTQRAKRSLKGSPPWLHSRTPPPSFDPLIRSL